jgi:hypothetical protein
MARDQTKANCSYCPSRQVNERRECNLPQIPSVIGTSYQFLESRIRHRKAVFVGGNLSEHVDRAVDRLYADGSCANMIVSHVFECRLLARAYTK